MYVVRRGQCRLDRVAISACRLLLFGLIFAPEDGDNIVKCMSDYTRGFGLAIGFIDPFSTQLNIYT
jgi:hypothetical protein